VLCVLRRSLLCRSTCALERCRRLRAGRRGRLAGTGKVFGCLAGVAGVWGRGLARLGKLLLLLGNGGEGLRPVHVALGHALAQSFHFLRLPLCFRLVLGVGLLSRLVRGLRELPSGEAHGVLFGALGGSGAERQVGQAEYQREGEQQERDKPGLAGQAARDNLPGIESAGVGFGVRVLQAKQGTCYRRVAELQGRRQPLFERQRRFRQPRGIHESDEGAGGEIAAQVYSRQWQEEQQKSDGGAVRQQSGAGQYREENVYDQRDEQSAHAAAYPALTAHAPGDQGERFAECVLLLQRCACLKCCHASPPFPKIGLLYQGGGCFALAALFAKCGQEHGPTFAGVSEVRLLSLGIRQIVASHLAGAFTQVAAYSED